MKKVFRFTTFALFFLATANQSLGFTGIFIFFLSPPDIKRSLPATNSERIEPERKIVTDAKFAISTFNDKIVQEFSTAWRRASVGASVTEAVVLILRMADGSFSARPMAYTNEFKKCTFPWHPATIAVVHTHPNGSDPKPLADDIALAERFKVPVFTITLRGMYVYDPFTKKISLVQDGLDWRNPEKWRKEIALK